MSSNPICPFHRRMNKIAPLISHSYMYKARLIKQRPILPVSQRFVKNAKRRRPSARLRQKVSQLTSLAFPNLPTYLVISIAKAAEVAKKDGKR